MSGLIIQPHPSQLPDHRAQTTLHHRFHNLLIPEISSLFDQATYMVDRNSERAWGVFMGIGNTFVLHLAPNFQTSVVYNPGERDKRHPMLVYGYSMVCSKRVMDKVREHFPLHHHDLPPQIAFGIQLKTYASPFLAQSSFSQMQDDLCDLIDGTIPFIETEHFTLFLLTPSGEKSLSFKRDGFPLQFWTHLSRTEALNGAIQKDSDFFDQLPNGPERTRLGQKLDMMLDASAIEDDITALNAQIKTLTTDIEKKEVEIRKRHTSIQTLQTTPGIPKARVEAQTANLLQQIQTFETQKNALINNLNLARATLQTKEQERDLFKQEHPSLPTSYLEPTFQIAADFHLPDGTHVYKRFSNTGDILTGTPDLAYCDEVHLRYNRMKV